jgi:hypothetical protein
MKLRVPQNARNASRVSAEGGQCPVSYECEQELEREEWNPGIEIRSI